MCCEVLISVTLCLVFFASVGGEIQSLAWDPRGERLAVLLKGITSLLFTLRNPVLPLNNCAFPRFSFFQAIHRQWTGLQSLLCSRREPAPSLSFCPGVYIYPRHTRVALVLLTSNVFL